MSIEETVQSLLAAALPAYGSPAVALVPANRIRVPDDQQALDRPYVLHGPIEEDPQYTHEGRVPMTRWMYQVSCFADRYSTARTIADAVIGTLQGHHGSTVFFCRASGPPQFEPDVRVHLIPVQFEVFN